MLQDTSITNLTRLLDASAIRAQVHASNIANQNTPGYHAQAVSFEDAFQQALADNEDDNTDGIVPVVYEARNTAEQADGNDVSVTKEVTEMAKNSTMYNAYAQMLRGKMRLMNIGITQAPGG